MAGKVVEMSSFLAIDLNVEARVNLENSPLHCTSREEHQIDFCGARHLPVMPQLGSLSPE